MRNLSTEKHTNELQALSRAHTSVRVSNTGPSSKCQWK